MVGGRSNVFLIGNEKDYLLVDTSWKQAWGKLQSTLDRLGCLERGRLAALILTHTHYDHADNAARVKERYGAKVIVHQAEAGYLASGDNLLPAGTAWFTRVPMALLGPRLSPLFRYPPVHADVEVGEMYDLSSMGFDTCILHTPGHTAGSMSVIVGGEVAVVGDAMFGVFPGSTFPPFGNDVPAMIKSWKKLLDTGCQIFLPSHGMARDRTVLEMNWKRRAPF